MNAMTTLPRRRTLWIALLIVLLLAGIGMLALKKRPAQAGQKNAAVSQPETVLEFLPGDLVRVAPGELKQVLALSGSLRAVRQAGVKAKVSGEVREVLVREGDSVHEGQVLIRMDSAEYQARLQQTQGALDAARGQLEIALKARDNNRALLEKNFISKNAYDNTQSQYAIAVANVASARGALDVTRKQLADTTLRAPIDGLVSSRSVEPGEKVSADNRLLDIVDLRRMELDAALPGADIVQITPGQEVTVRVEGLPQSLTGKVARINPAVQAGSRSIPVHIALDNPQGVLRVGMFAEAQLTLSQKSGVLTVPTSALREEAGQSLVYAIENGRLVSKAVVPGAHGNDAAGAAVEIIKGLAPDATVVRTNMGVLRSGSKVTIREPAGSSASLAPPR